MALSVNTLQVVFDYIKVATSSVLDHIAAGGIVPCDGGGSSRNVCIAVTRNIAGLKKWKLVNLIQG